MKHCLLFLLLAIPGLLWAQQPAPCSSEEHRQFDFWIGNWDVYVGEELAGTNQVELILGSCVLMENWQGSKGGTGKSFNLYNRESGKWEQTWVDSQGGIIRFEGNFAEGVMAMKGQGKTKEGAPLYYQLTFTDNGDGTVRQLWEASTDQENWQAIFDGLYKPHVD